MWMCVDLFCLHNYYANMYTEDHEHDKEDGQDGRISELIIRRIGIAIANPKLLD